MTCIRPINCQTYDCELLFIIFNKIIDIYIIWTVLYY